MQFSEKNIRGPLRSKDDMLGSSLGSPDRKLSNQRVFTYLSAIFKKNEELQLFPFEGDGKIVNFTMPLSHKVIREISIFKSPQTSKRSELYEAYLVFKSPEEYVPLIQEDPQHAPNLYIWAQDTNGQRKMMYQWVIEFSFSKDGNCTIGTNHESVLSDIDRENIRLLTQVGRLSATPPEENIERNYGLLPLALLTDSLATASRQYPQLPRY